MISKHLRMLAAVVALTFASTIQAEPPQVRHMPSRNIMSGSIGPYRIGADLLVAPDHEHIIKASYFYASRGIDIPLRASTENGEIVLTESDGGTFHLRFEYDGQSKPSLNFYTSTGLVGTWSGEGKVYPAQLDMDFQPAGDQDEGWYADVTNLTDEAFEARARRFLSGVATGNRVMAAGAVSYPLTINGKRTRHIANPSQLLSQWNTIFTRGYVAALKGAIWHKMFVREGMAMTANGLVWFDGRGAKVLNIGS